MKNKSTVKLIKFPMAVLMLLSLMLAGLTACTSYELNEGTDQTLSGSIKKMMHKDKGRKASVGDKYDQAPIYVDYSKNNPILLHDDEFDEDKKYKDADPFDESVEFEDFEKMKKKKDAKRRMEQEHKETDKDKGVSLW